MNIIDLEQLKDIRNGEKASEERYSRDRSMYLKGKSDHPEQPPESLSERDRACYMMGYNTAEDLKLTYNLDV